MKLTLEQKIGQLMIIGWQSDRAEDIVELIERYHFGNVVLFTRNIKSPEQIKKTISKIQEAALKYNGIPALISIDQEGGNVRRIYEGVTSVPGHMAIGAASYYDANAAYKIGKIVGQELKALGINCNFSPIADVNSNQMNPIIGIRAFSDDPDKVSMLAAEYAKGLDENNVIGSYKHFIGHGNVIIDSHLDLPHLNSSYEDLLKVELVPYLNKHFTPKAIMTAHILYNQIDDRFPATLSKKIINDMLRKEMKYDGLVITDCFEMDAISRAFALEEAGVYALKATVDLILVSHTFGRQMKVRNGLIRAVKENEISMEELDKRVNNVIRHKMIYTNDDFNKEIDYQKNQQIADEVSLNSITLLDGEAFEIDDNTVVIGVTNYLNSIAEDKNIENMDIAKIIGEEFNISYRSIDNKNFNINEIAIFAKNKKVILALSDSHLTLIQRVLYSQLRQNNKELMLISLRTPYDVFGQEKPNSHYAVYEYTKQSISSLLKILKGEKARGKSPVKLIPTNGNGEEVDIKNQLVRNAVEFLEANYATNITLSEVAIKLLVSDEHLSRLIKKETNVTFIDHLTMIRIRHARHYLKTTNLRVYEVALLVGFSDANYFTKKFKKLVGLTPQEFRNSL